MKKFVDHGGWRMYTLTKTDNGTIGISPTRKAKWFPADTPINSTWLDRDYAAELLRKEKTA